jgi:hypothetical protein
MEMFQTHICIDNYKCDSTGSFLSYVSAYFSPEGFIMVQFSDFWGTPGVARNTFVCRPPSPPRLVNDACDEGTCNRLEMNELGSLRGTSFCFFNIVDGSPSVTFMRSVHQFSTATYLASAFRDMKLTLKLNLSPAAAGDTDACKGAIAGDYTSEAHGWGPTLETHHYTYVGKTNNGQNLHYCRAYNGMRLMDWGTVGGKIVDPGPADVEPLSVYPRLQPGQRLYMIPLSEANGRPADILYIPDGVTLKANPDVQKIDWSFRKIKFGRDAELDVSAPSEKPPRGADASGPMPQADYCKFGRPGGDGSPGSIGRSGVSLTIRGIEEVEANGTLWVKTDGEPGADGGSGQNGQVGGGHRPNFWGCDGQPGGYGGNGGSGGAGGATSAVTLQFLENEKHKITFNIAGDCGTTTPPSIEPGAISIWGAGGCGGQGGNKGNGGDGGESYAHKGQDGFPGATGLNGALGHVSLQYPP